MNLSRGLNLPKTGFNRAPAEILKNLIQFLVELAIFEPRLKFKPRLKFFKFGFRCPNLMNLSRGLNLPKTGFI